MFIITLISEAISERTIVSMMEDLWILPFIVAIYAQSKDGNPWIFFVNYLSYSLVPGGIFLLLTRFIYKGLSNRPTIISIYSGNPSRLDISKCWLSRWSNS